MFLVLGISCASYLTFPFCLFCWYLLFELRHHLHTITCMDLRGTAQWVLIMYIPMRPPSTTVNTENISFSLKCSLVSLCKSVVSLQPGNPTLICFLSLSIGFVCSRTSYKWISTVCMFLCLAFFTQHHVFEINPCHCVCQGFFSFHF